ncbi:MAG TPA: hypothetical protein VN257_08815 [Actinotalea sp.]|nr:hypothetical protein [Actinotalea sp.]
MTDPPTRSGRLADPPEVTACLLCAGETLGDSDGADGGQLARLRRLADEGVARLAVVECLDECDRGDVLVVRRPRGEGESCDTWFERLAGDAPTAALAAWLRVGAPCAGRLPAALDRHRFVAGDRVDGG